MPNMIDLAWLGLGVMLFALKSYARASSQSINEMICS